LDGPLPKWYPAVALSRQVGRHSAVALLLKAALIQVSDYRLLGASGFISSFRLIDMLFILCGPAMSWSLHNGSRIFLGTSQKYGLVKYDRLLYNK
jgi:hypothetical protein